MSSESLDSDSVSYESLKLRDDISEPSRPMTPVIMPNVGITVGPGKNPFAEVAAAEEFLKKNAKILDNGVLKTFDIKLNRYRKATPSEMDDWIQAKYPRGRSRTSLASRMAKGYPEGQPLARKFGISPHKIIYDVLRLYDTPDDPLIASVDHRVNYLIVPPVQRQRGRVRQKKASAKTAERKSERDFAKQSRYGNKGKPLQVVYEESLLETGTIPNDDPEKPFIYNPAEDEIVSEDKKLYISKYIDTYNIGDMNALYWCIKEMTKGAKKRAREFKNPNNGCVRKWKETTEVFPWEWDDPRVQLTRDAHRQFCNEYPHLFKPGPWPITGQYLTDKYKKEHKRYGYSSWFPFKTNTPPEVRELTLRGVLFYYYCEQQGFIPGLIATCKKD